MEKFLVAFIGTLILYVGAFVAVFLPVMAFKSFGLWGAIVPVLMFATLAGVMEMRGK